MGMFGRSARQQQPASAPAGYATPEHSTGAQLLNLLGMNLLGVNVLGQRDRNAAQDKYRAFAAKLQGLTQPQYQDGPGADVTPTGGYMPGVMGLPSVSTPGGPPGSAAGYQPPIRTADPINAADPRLAALQVEGQGVGYDTSKLMDVLKMQQPHMMSAQDGTLVNDKSSKYEGMQFPKLDNGIISRRGPNGELLGASALPGYADAAASIAGATKGAEAKAQAPYDFINVPGPDGRPGVMSKLQAAGGAFFGQAPDDAEYRKGRAGAASDTMKGLQTAGQLAPTKIARYHQIDGLLAGFEGGKLAPTGMEMASALNSLGFKMSPKLQNAQAADALSKQLVLDLNGGSLGTGFSNADRDFLQSTVPSILQSAGSRRQLIGIGIATEQRKQDVANKARQWEQRFGRIDTPDATGKTFQDYVEAWSAKNPVFPHK